MKESEVTARYHKMRSSAGDVVNSVVIAMAWGSRTDQLCQISFSGCKDNQTSADVVKNGLGKGAMSDAFMECLSGFFVDSLFRGQTNFESSAEANPKQSYKELLKSIRKILRKNYSQKAQLSISHKIV